MTSTSFWFVNKPGDVSGDALTEYLARGEWRCPDPVVEQANLRAMHPGDRIALKVVSNRTVGLPFFNADRPVSTMRILAPGTVTAVDAESGVVAVEWTSSEPRDWYMYTTLQPMWRVDPDAKAFARNLVDFAFNGEPQGLEEFLSKDHWGSRYAHWPQFTWIPFYEEFATRLLAFRQDRTELVSILGDLADAEPLLDYVSRDQFIEGTFEPIADIDPFTFMGTFNRGVTLENRRSIAERLGQALGVNVPPPDDFDGIPILNNQNSWFMSYGFRRRPKDIDTLWHVLESALGFASEPSLGNRTQLADAYDAALTVRGIKWNVSVGLYWVRPGCFPTLDSRSRQYIARHYSMPEPTSGSEYLALCDTLLERFESGTTSITSFPLLSYAAWMGDVVDEVPHTVAGFATWASRLSHSLDLNEGEHDYKRNAARLAAQARDEARAGSQDWPATLKKALNSTNTIDFRFRNTLKHAIEIDPEAGLEVLETVWSSPGPESLDALQEALREFLGKVTPGNATALGAILLMADDPESNAPYSTTRTDRWYEVTGFAGATRTTSASVRYQTMLDFLDALRGELAAGPDGMEVSRLEAQGMAWTVTEWPPPEDWEESERQALLAWRGQSPEPPRAWLARTTASGQEWLEDGYISLAASYLGTLEPGSSLAEVKEAIEAGYQHQEYAQRKALAEEYYAFLTVMKHGDVVGVIHDGQLHVGVVEGGAEYLDGRGDRLRRAVAWAAEVPTGELPPAISSLMDRQGSVVDITEALNELQGLLAAPTGPRVQADLRLPRASQQLSDDLFMPLNALQEILDLLDSRKQIVLYGPPGTGKTYIAKALARHIIGADDPSRVQLVQFHPSYSYEDFFEGYRPHETESGQATFTLQPGPLARIASEARAHPNDPYVLVIDEMNRANLAKVFGELYFLLEYRKESMQLQYRPSVPFQLPENLFIIGTMNTADRSIALLDAAMRRRFSFVELHPDEEPVKGVLALWLAHHKRPAERADLLQALNAAIEDQDRDLRIGPSYLMRDEAATEEGLVRVWKYDILPLLEEHYYGRLTRDQIHDRFGLNAIRAVLHGGVLPEATEAEPDELFEDGPTS